MGITKDSGAAGDSDVAATNRFVPTSVGARYHQGNDRIRRIWVSRLRRSSRQNSARFSPDAWSLRRRKATASQTATATAKAPPKKTATPAQGSNLQTRKAAKMPPPPATAAITIS